MEGRGGCPAALVSPGTKSPPCGGLFWWEMGQVLTARGGLLCLETAFTWHVRQRGRAGFCFR